MSIYVKANEVFPLSTWNAMVIEASCSEKRICKVIYPSQDCMLELKTNQEVKEFFEEHGRWNANCGRMPLREVINITRMNLNSKGYKSSKIQKALEVMAVRSENKYNAFCGTLRKIISWIFNVFTTNSVGLFSMPKTNCELYISKIKENKLPFLIGHDANFARTVAKKFGSSG